AADRGGKSHVAFVHRHAQMAEKPRQVGIIGPVENDEASIHRDGAAVIIHRDGAAVAADTGSLLIDRDVVAWMEQKSRAQSGNACPDDRDPSHGPSPFRS